MPTLTCFVSDETLTILKHEAEKRGRGETPELLAEAAIENAAIDVGPPPLRDARDARREFDLNGNDRW